jgi:hypothetical protein
MKKIFLSVAVFIFVACGGVEIPQNEESREEISVLTESEEPDAFFFEPNYEIPQNENSQNENSQNENSQNEIPQNENTREEIHVFEELTEYGHIVAQEFLGGYTSLFLEYGDALIYLEKLLGLDLDFDEADPHSIARHANKLDAHINNLRDDRGLIDPANLPDALKNEPSFCRDLRQFASGFWLYEIDGGVPLIGIHFISMFANGPTPVEFFTYENGYSHTGTIDLRGEIFRDSDGRLVTLTGDYWDELPTLTYISFEDGKIKMEHHEDWHALIETDPNVRDVYWERETHLIPDMPLWELTSVRLDDLKGKIINNMQPLARERRGLQ